jgi:hypothetical protein
MGVEFGLLTWERNTEPKILFGIAGVMAEFWTEHLPNANLEGYNSWYPDLYSRGAAFEPRLIQSRFFGLPQSLQVN